MRLVIVLILISLLITGCSNVKTYTFKRDRVDQDVQEGNRGYLLGDPPPAEDREGLKRELIGVDIELPILPWEEEEISVPPKAKGGTVEAPPIEDKKVIFEIPEKKEPETIKGEIVEEEWIK